MEAERWAVQSHLELYRNWLIKSQIGFFARWVCMCGVCRVPKKTREGTVSMEMVLQVVVSCQTWVLGTKCGSLGEALNIWAIFPSPDYKLLIAKMFINENGLSHPWAQKPSWNREWKRQRPERTGSTQCLLDTGLQYLWTSRTRGYQHRNKPVQHGGVGFMNTYLKLRIYWLLGGGESVFLRVWPLVGCQYSSGWPHTREYRSNKHKLYCGL